MEYIYAAMLIHKAGKTVDEASVKRVLEAVGIKADEGKVKALIASLTGVDIDKVIKEAAVPVAVQADKKEEGKEEKKKEEDKASEQKAAAGLGALFG